MPGERSNAPVLLVVLAVAALLAVVACVGALGVLGWWLLAPMPPAPAPAPVQQMPRSAPPAELGTFPTPAASPRRPAPPPTGR
jgi:hypothetical protein